jgi:hypothetical protein
MKETSNSIVVIAQSEQLPEVIPSEIRLANSLIEAKSENLIARGEAYIIFRKYIGLNPTGSKPWVVTSYEGDHQIIISQHQSLITAIEGAKEVNGMNVNTLQRPESAIVTFIGKLFKSSQ